MTAFADRARTRDRRAAAADQRDRARQARITADTDLRLARYFGMSEGSLSGCRRTIELMERKRAIGDKLKAIQTDGGVTS